MKKLHLFIPIFALYLVSANMCSYESYTREIIETIIKSQKCNILTPAQEAEQLKKLELTYTYEQRWNYIQRAIFAMASSRYLTYVSNHELNMLTQLLVGTVAFIGTTFFAYEQMQRAVYIQKLEAEQSCAQHAYDNKIIRQLINQLQNNKDSITKENIGWLNGLLKRDKPQMPTDKELKNTMLTVGNYCANIGYVIILTPYARAIIRYYITG